MELPYYVRKAGAGASPRVAVFGQTVPDTQLGRPGESWEDKFLTGAIGFNGTQVAEGDPDATPIVTATPVMDKKFRIRLESGLKSVDFTVGNGYVLTASETDFAFEKTHDSLVLFNQIADTIWKMTALHPETVGRYAVEDCETGFSVRIGLFERLVDGKLDPKPSDFA